MVKYPAIRFRMIPEILVTEIVIQPQLLKEIFCYRIAVFITAHALRSPEKRFSLTD